MKLAVVLLLLLLPTPPAQATTGRASWFVGHRGACGPLRGLYAAHRELPCRSHVRVAYRGRSVVVTILDRGPARRDRELDLSKRAFSRLARPSRGVIDVTYERVS